MLRTSLFPLVIRVADLSCRPIEIVRAGSLLIPSQSTSRTLADILPSTTAFDQLQKSLDLASPAPALSILDSLIPSHSPAVYSESYDSLPDAAGFTSYVRCVVAILEIAARDHAWARKSVWLLPHLLLVADAARDELAISGSSPGLFDKSVRSDTLDRLVTASDGLVSYILSSVANDLPANWHTSTVSQLRSKVPVESSETLLGVLDGLGRLGRETGGVYARRAFCKVVHTTLRYTEGSVVDAERWLAFAQNLGEGLSFYSVATRLELM